MVLPYINYNIDEVGAKNIPELEDVILTNLSNGQALIYDSTTELFTNQDVLITSTISTVDNEVLKKDTTTDTIVGADIISTASTVGTLTKQKTIFAKSTLPFAVPLSSIESKNDNGVYSMFLNPKEGNTEQKRMTINAFLNDIFVGINTDTPLEGLHLLGSFRIDNNTTQQIRFYNIQGTTKEAATIKVDDNGGGADILFLTRPSGGVEPTEKMIIDKAGNVGIGLTNPSEKLDVNGNIQVANKILGTNDNLLLYTSTTGPNSYGFLEMSSFITSLGSSQFRILTGSDNTTAGSERLRILSNGNVGIGTDNPSEKLDVNGNIQFNGTLSVGTTPSKGTAGQVLTSQGSVNPPQWVLPITPVYVAVLKNGDKAISVPATTTTFATVDGMTIDYQSAPIGTTAYNESSGEFTAPRTGIYIIDYAVNVIDDSPHYTEFIGATVSINRGSGFVREMSQNYADVQRQTLLYTLRAHYMTQLNAGDIVKNEIQIYNNSVSVTSIRGNATTARATYQTIHSIT